jgi:aspartyl-tRNA(Asn)/glutamyl-tRNA(Gln) amidotransferase subunit C
MDITKEIVNHLALLARLELDEEEKILLNRDLNSILKYMDKLNEIDTKGVDPLSHVLPVNNRFREDVIDESIIEKDPLINAPDSDRGYFRVPKIIE